ncbi:hypothetical protein [Pseudomonas sp. R9.37]|uniref:hypothetical protein n=1 Tax=Pseudomonas sp. R9.37 TaxID=1390498 RepID=UPI001304B5E5|nr:hypothetical protein [Pseudomonas sp. R9.37]
MTNVHTALDEKLADVMVPGFEAEFDPNEADHAGSFREDALCIDDAADSSSDQ